MTLYEINQAMLNLIDDETGEILDVEAFDKLGLDFSTKIENIACWYKNLISDVEGLKAEEKALADRRKHAENTANRLKGYLDYWLQGQKFETSKVKVSYRKSTSVEVGENFIDWARNNNHLDLLTMKQPEPNKTAIKKFIKDGKAIQGAVIVEKNNISVS